RQRELLRDRPRRADVVRPTAEDPHRVELALRSVGEDIVDVGVAAGGVPRDRDVEGRPGGVAGADHRAVAAGGAADAGVLGRAGSAAVDAALAAVLHAVAARRHLAAAGAAHAARAVAGGAAALPVGAGRAGSAAAP